MKMSEWVKNKMVIKYKGMWRFHDTVGWNVIGNCGNCDFSMKHEDENMRPDFRQCNGGTEPEAFLDEWKNVAVDFGCINWVKR